MNKCFSIAVVALLLSSCHDSLDDRAEKETKSYTERYCPTTVRDNQRTDSLTFTRSTHTYNYFYTLVGPADNEEVVSKNKSKVTEALLNSLKNDTRMRAYKEAGFNFHFVYRSGSTGKVLLDVTFTGKDINGPVEK